MIDNASLIIEQMAVDLNGSHKDAFLAFMYKHDIYDPEDLLEVISPILREKIKQEFRAKNYFNNESENSKQENLEDLF